MEVPVHRTWLDYLGVPDQIDLTLLDENIHEWSIITDYGYSSFSEWMSRFRDALHPAISCLHTIADLPGGAEALQAPIQIGGVFTRALHKAFTPTSEDPWVYVDGYEPLTWYGARDYRARHCIDQTAQWRDQGLCPQCGEVGKYIGFAPVCSTHGPY